MRPDLAAALERGALVVTPTRRRARAIADAFDRQRRAAGATAWPAPAVLSWSTFVDELLRTAQEAGLDVPPRRLGPAQEAWLWRSIIERDASHSPLADEASLARLASEAFRLVYAHGEGGESWRGFGPVGLEGEAFARWSEAFLREADRHQAVDAARRADHVARVAAGLPRVAALDVFLAGHLELEAQAARLVDSLRAAGARIELQHSDAGASCRPKIFAARSPREEMVHALRWARARVEADPAARVAIALPDLARHRRELQWLCELHLSGERMWPGRETLPRPYEIADATPLAALPIVASALDLLIWPHRPLARVRAVLALRSPWLPGSAGEIGFRAGLERDWLEDGIAQIGWNDVLQALRSGRDQAGDGADGLAATWQRASRSVPLPARALPRQWTRCWRDWLDALGWARGARALSSDEYQAQVALHEALSEFAQLDAVTPALSASDAVAAFRELVTQRRFQPQSLAVPIRVLSLADAAGADLDALWVCGLTATAWPRAAEPHPLLPIPWQRDRGLPHASAARELDYARHITAELARTAPEVVFSYADRIDDHRVLPSPLLADWLPADPLPEPAEDCVTRAFRERPVLETIDDTVASALEPGAPLRGGASLVQAQSDCPFQAAAKYRLRSREWPVPPAGLTAAERGLLIHGALAVVFTRIADYAQLAALAGPQIDALLRDAFRESLQGLRRRQERTRRRLDALPPAVLVAETRRITGRIASWLELERDRGAFGVIACEREVTVAVAGHALNARIDRIDRLADGSVAVIDYKSGRATTPEQWLKPRPQALQVAVYARAVRQALGAPVGALAYAQLRAGRVAAVGIARDAVQWPALEPGATPGMLSFDEVLGRMDTEIDALVTAFAAGQAMVAPRERKVCGFCRLEALCRIRPRTHELSEDERADAADAIDAAHAG